MTMKVSRTAVLFLIASAFPISAYSSDNGVALDVRGIVSAYGSSSDPNADVRAQASGLAGPLTATEHAFRTDSGAGGVADATVIGNYGSFSYSAVANANQTTHAPGSAYVGGDGQPAYQIWDKLTVTGSAGSVGTFRIHLGLKNVSVSSSNGENSGIEKTGIQSDVSYHNGSSSINSTGKAYSYIDNGTSHVLLDYIDIITLHVGETLYVSSTMRGAAVAINDWDGTVKSANASAYGEGFLYIDSLTSGVELSATSGHRYDAVPESGSVFALGLFGIGFLRRKTKK